MDRFSAQLMLQRQLRQRNNRQGARAVEAVMDALARHRVAAGAADADGELWGTLALLSFLDVELCEHNERERGRVAAELAQAAGVPAAMCDALAAARQAPPDEASPVALALVLAEWLGRRVDRAVDGDVEAQPGDGGAASAETVARELELRAGRGDARGDRLDAALAALDLEPAQAAALAVDALRALREVKP